MTLKSKDQILKRAGMNLDCNACEYLSFTQMNHVPVDPLKAIGVC